MCQRSLTLRISRAQISTTIQRSYILSFQTSSTKVRYSTQQYQQLSNNWIGGKWDKELLCFRFNDAFEDPIKISGRRLGNRSRLQESLPPPVARIPILQCQCAPTVAVTWRPAHVVYLVLHSVQWHGETKINIISISNWATKFVWAQTRNILCLFYTNGTHT